jgi:arylsulfatase A-like enzyme
MIRQSCTRRDFLKTAGFGAVSLAFSRAASGVVGAASRPAESKPNIIVILADDLGYGDVGCYGNKTIKTPHIDALAASGMRFTDFHSNGPMCSPTRAAFLTGRYQQRCGLEHVLGWDHDEGIALDEVTFAEVLKTAGYATAAFGKWHVGYVANFGPAKQGFDEFRGYSGGCLDYHSHIDRQGNPDWWKDDKLVPEEGYVTDLVSDHTVSFMERNKDRPFCIYASHLAVHFPYQGPNDKADRVAGQSWHHLKRGSRKDRKAAYKEMIESMDAGVGRIVQAVKRLGLEKRTLIFFASDNGAYLSVGSNLPCRGEKTDLWEGGHRVPAIAWWPGKIKPGTVTDQTTMTMDLFATMVDMAAAKLPKDLKLDGVSLLPLLKQNKKLSERTLFWRFKKKHAVRKGPWKLLIRGDKQHLFNLDQDIAEANDLSAAKPDMVKALEAEFLAWEKDVTAGVTWVRK